MEKSQIPVDENNIFGRILSILPLKEVADMSSLKLKNKTYTFNLQADLSSTT